MIDSDPQNEARMRRALDVIDKLQTRLIAAEQSSGEPIAIVGMSCRFPGGADSPESFWEGLLEGRDAIRPVPTDRWDADSFYDPTGNAPGKTIAREGGFIEDVHSFDADFFGVSPREAKKLDPQQRLLLEVAWEAMERAGIIPRELSGKQVGVFLGISSNDYSRLLATQSRDGIDAYDATGNSLSVAAGRLSYVFGFEGPSMSVDTACSSSLVAVHVACQSLRNRECDAALIGGVNLILTPDLSITFSQAQMLAPDGRCKTFSASADGFARAEGCGVLVAKRLSDARAAGDHVLAVIRGSAVNQDGRSGGLTVPNGPAQQRVIQDALKRSNVLESQIDYIEAHGTGTELGDPIELQALGNVFSMRGSSASPLFVGSVKTNLGHLEAAAGIAGLMKVVLAMQHELIPRHLHCDELTTHVPWDRMPVQVVQEPRDWQSTEPRIAGISSFGFSGTNAHVILESCDLAGAEQPSDQGDKDGYSVLLISARSDTSLRMLASRYASHLEEGADWLDTCWSSHQFRSQFESRLAIVSDSNSDAAKQLRRFSEHQVVNLPGPADVPPTVAPLIETAQGFCRGEKVAWPGIPGNRIQLPTYAFNRKRFWVDASSNVEDKPCGMVDTPITLARSDTTCSQAAPSLFRAERWKTHCLSETPVIPAVGLIEMVVETLAKSGINPSDCVFSDIRFASPLVVRDDQVAQVICERSDDEIQAEVVSSSSPPNWTTNCRLDARIGETQRSSIIPPSFDEVQDLLRGSQEVPADAIYNRLRQQGITYGDGWKIVDRARMDGGRVAANLVLDEADENFEFDPLVLDACVQLIGAAFVEEQRVETYLPAGVGKMIFHQSRISGGQFVACADVTHGDDWISADLHLFDADGHCLVSFVDFVIRPFDMQRLAADVGKHESMGDTSVDESHQQGVFDWLYQLQWVPEKLRSSGSIDPSRIVTSLKPDFRSKLQQPMSLEYLEGLGQLDQWAATFAREIAKSVDPDEVIESQRHLYSHLVDVAGSLSGASLDWPRDCGPGMAHEFRILERCAKNIPAVLRGEKLPLEVLFPDGDSDELNWLYESSTGARLMNSQVRAVVEGIMDSAPRPLRILEIGGGTGGTTSCLAPLFKDFGEYVFTDIAALLVDRASQRFGDHSKFKFCRLDIESSPLTQGFERHCFDVVLAANVLHATSDLDGVLSNIHQLLKPTGQLVMLEGTRSLLWLDLIFGLTEGWWSFADPSSNEKATATSNSDESREHPLMSIEKWESLLNRSGYDVATLSDADLPQAVFVSAVVREADRVSGSTHPVLIKNLGDVHAEVLREQIEPHSDLQRMLFFASEPDSASCTEQLHRDLGGLLDWVQSWVASESLPTQLFVVTRGATGPNCYHPLEGALQGMARTIELEFPELHVCRIDLDPIAPIDQQLADIANEINSGSHGSILYRDRRRFVGRMAKVEPHDRLPCHPNEPFRLKRNDQGAGNQIELEAMVRRAPGEAEVEIQVEAAGANFIDALDMAGLLPFERDWIGGEFAGTVVAVGGDVAKFQIGDRVVGLAPGAFASHVIAPAALVACLPGASLTGPHSFPEAATIPANVLTAKMALCDIGRLKAGERVLIHAAAGGTGLAAVRVAMALGAEVYATASQGKWQYLKSIGVRHIFDSRSLSFAGEVMDATSGKGVHVVLNSLTGEYVDEGLKILASRGRFVEIGKRDIRSSEQVHKVRTDVEYHVFDLMAICESIVSGDQGYASAPRSLFDEHAELTITQPLPKTVFPMEEASRAIRYLQRAHHIGKVVLDFSETRSPITKNATYLITGGLGGLGIKTAEWLVEHGAGRILLLGRSIPEPIPEPLRQLLQQADTDIELLSCDVTDFEQLRRAIEIANSNGLLRGIVHAAGVLHDGMLRQLKWSDMFKVLGPKVLGAQHLHQLTMGLSLDFFVLYSSAASLIGSAGQASHVSANAYLDSLAHHRRCLGLPAQTINWGPWSEVGSAASEKTRSHLELHGIGIINPDAGLAALDRIMQCPDLTQVGVVPVDWSQMARHVPASDRLLVDLLPKSQDVERASTKKLTEGEWRKQLRDLPSGAREAALVSMLQHELGRVLGFSSDELPAIDRGIFDLGIDSLMSVELKNRLVRNLGVEIPSTLLFQYPTISALAPKLIESMENREREQSPHQESQSPRVSLNRSAVDRIPPEDRKEVEAELEALERLLGNHEPP